MTASRILSSMIALHETATHSGAAFFWIGKPVDRLKPVDQEQPLHEDLIRQGVSAHACLAITADVSSLLDTMSEFGIDDFTLEIGTHTAVRSKLALCGYRLASLSQDDEISEEKVSALQFFEAGLGFLATREAAGDMRDFEVSYTMEDEEPDHDGSKHIYRTPVRAASPRAAATILAHAHAASRLCTAPEDIDRCLEHIRGVSHKYPDEIWAPFRSNEVTA